MPREGPEANGVGRVGADLYPAAAQVRRPLSRIERYHRYVGGFAGNVATGLARLGVRVAIVSRVGDDGHGEFIRAFLEAEGVDVRWLSTDPELRTPSRSARSGRRTASPSPSTGPPPARTAGSGWRTST